MYVTICQVVLVDVILVCSSCLFSGYVRENFEKVCYQWFKYILFRPCFVKQLALSHETSCLCCGHVSAHKLVLQLCFVMHQILLSLRHNRSPAPTLPYNLSVHMLVLQLCILLIFFPFLVFIEGNENLFLSCICPPIPLPKNT